MLSKFNIEFHREIQNNLQDEISDLEKMVELVTEERDDLSVETNRLVAWLFDGGLTLEEIHNIKLGKITDALLLNHNLI
jgi:ABC-type phosphate transport system auxiliary subunit